jgi:hypothetical protein
LKTRIFTTKVKGSAGNSLAENSIQRIRQLACTLVEDVAQKTGLSYPCEHPLWSWAGRYAAWCLNRYQVGRSLTAYEVTQGKRYYGKVARFGEPVYGYCNSRGKADAKWKVGLFLGKTENQDAWIIGDGVDVMLSRSIRRVDRPWTNFLAYYSGLQTHSFVYQTNFGGRIVPTKRKIIPQKQDGRLLPKLSEVERDALLTKRPMQFRPMLVPDRDDWKLNKKFNKHLQNFLIKHPQDRESLWRRLQ